VDAGPDLDPQVADAPDDRLRAAHGTCRPVERDHEPVARRVDLSAADALVVRGQELAPEPAAQLGRALGGADDVGEQDGRQNPVDVGRASPARQEVLGLVQDGVLGRAPGASAS
jgi:hypothetical protein